jgi:hypothetical protein
MNFDDLITCSCDEDLKLASFVEGTIEEGKQALMGYIGPVFRWVLVQLIGNVVAMIVAIQKDILMLFVSCDLEWRLL